jgi:hypothetical protein
MAKSKGIITQIKKGKNIIPSLGLAGGTGKKILAEWAYLP